MHSQQGGEVSGNQRPSGPVTPCSVPCILHLLGEFHKRSGRPTELVGGGRGLASRTTSWRRGFLHPSLRTGRTWMELERWRASMCAKTQDQPQPHSTLPRPVSVFCPSLWPQEPEIMREPLLLQVAANHYNFNLGPGSRTWSSSVRMRGEARQEWGEGRYRLHPHGQLFRVVGSESLCTAVAPWSAPHLGAWGPLVHLD